MTGRLFALMVALIVWSPTWAGEPTCQTGRTRTCYSGPAGTLGQGVCSGGVQTCVDALWGACEDEVAPVAEVCNGVDDDCDGRVDEALDTNACGRCGALPEEICNAVDDDCDGQVDEGDCPACDDGARVTCYSGPPGTVGVGMCSRGVAICVDGAWGACEDEQPPVAEGCNGVDDDCDGRLDEEAECPACADGAERICFDGPQGAAGVGICSFGLQRCVEGAWGPCADQRQPEPERCNGIDEDCDGAADERLEGCDRCAVGAERPCYSGPEGSAGLGVCQAGRQGCEQGVWGACDEAVLPGVEICNGLDDDCDGRADEGTVLNACGTCGAAPDETCNDGADEDCDGLIDEGCPAECEGTTACYGGPVGTSGVGICRAGTRSCAFPGGICNGQFLPGVERCDGEDEDCDGAVDEGLDCLGQCRPGSQRTCYDGPLGSEGIGRCAAGTQTCGAQSVWGPCEQQRLPADETCDATDQDCDGRVDEDGSGVSLSLCCEAAERCNGIDDDCDGTADEGFAGLGDLCFIGESCQVGGTNVCDPSGSDTTVCVLGEQPERFDRCGEGLRCNDDWTECVPAADERCNSRDDDNDGRVDEGFGVLGSACVVDPQLGCQREGALACGEGGAAAICVERPRGLCIDNCQPFFECDTDCGRCVRSGCASRAGCGGPCDVGGEEGICSLNLDSGSCVCALELPTECTPVDGVCGGDCSVDGERGICIVQDGNCGCNPIPGSLVDAGPQNFTTQGSHLGQGCGCDLNGGGKGGGLPLAVLAVLWAWRRRR